AATPAAHAEQIVENVREGGGEIGAEAVSAAALLEGGMTEAIIGGALVAVLEDVIGFVELLEAVLALLVTRIAVRMVLHGQLAEGRLDLHLAGGARHAQDFVVIAFRHVSASPRAPAVVSS